MQHLENYLILTIIRQFLVKLIRSFKLRKKNYYWYSDRDYYFTMPVHVQKNWFIEQSNNINFKKHKYRWWWLLPGPQYWSTTSNWWIGKWLLLGKCSWRKNWIGTSVTPDDFSATYKIVWDNNYIFLLINVTDDIIKNEDTEISNYWKGELLSF